MGMDLLCGVGGRRSLRGLRSRSCGRSLFDIIRLRRYVRHHGANLDGGEFCQQKNDFRASRADSVVACGSVWPRYRYMSALCLAYGFA